MRLPGPLRARDPVAAARATSYVGLLAAVAVAVAAVVDPHDATPAAQALCWTAAPVLLLLARLCRRVDPRRLDRTILFVTVAGLTVMGLLAQLLDRQEELVARLRARADADGLIGVLQRRVVDDRVDRAMARGEVAVLVVDVDHFKQVDDQHGHLVGDDALVHLTQVMRSQLRRTDCTVGRLGGDELVMVLPGCSAAGLAARAEDLVAAVRRAPLPLPDGGVLPLTVSVGGAHAPTDADDLRGLYAAADEALYRAERAGRDGFSLAAEPSSSRAGGSGA